MAAPGKEMFVNPNTTSSSPELSNLSPTSVGSVPPSSLSQLNAGQVSQITTPQPEKPKTDVLGKVGNNTSDALSKTQKDYLEKGAPARAKAAAADILGDKGLVNDLPEDLWDSLGAYVVNGEIDLEKTRSANQLANAVNSIKGSRCMGQTIDDNFIKGLFDNLAGFGFNLSLADLFRCLSQELKGMGSSFVNTVTKNNNKIVRDSTLNALEGTTNVLGKGTKDAVPNYRNSLGSFESTGDSKKDYTKVNNTMKNVDPNWDKSGNNTNLSTYSNMSPAAKTAVSNHGTKEQKFNVALSKLF